ncbi:MAG: Gfo/Idh/MocA family oxidoreductase [Leptolyngbyaceae bacterium]|nr:Gfo/Idh/MocA family oxidoreductase [Leptolyngbyaceae bacterium]
MADQANQSVGIDLLGVGRWGTHVLRNFLELPQATVRAIADTCPDNLQRAADRFDFPPGLIITNQWQEAIATKGVEAVVIVTPASTHTEIIRTALDHDCHVLVEKPITLDIQEAEDLCALAQQKQRCLMVDHTYLFHPAVAAGHGVMQDGSIGAPRYGYASRTHLGPVRPDVDALWDLAIHDISIFNHWLGDRPCQVQAWGHTWLQPDSAFPPLFPNGLSDVVWATLTYPSGFQSTLHLCWSNPDKQRRLCLVGSDGTLVFDEMQHDQPLTLMKGHFTQEGRSFIPDGQCHRAIAVDSAEPLNQMCTHFLAQVRGGSQLQFPAHHSDGVVGTDLIRVLTALSRSLNEGGRAIAIE